MDRSFNLHDMSFQFCLGGTPLEPQEAMALFSATTAGSGKKPMIELDHLIDFNNLDPGKLFELAINKQNEELASLAWKISIQQTKKDSSKQSAQRTSTKLKVLDGAVKTSETELDDIISYLNRTTSYATLGVAMLLKATSEKEWVTLRETAVNFANDLMKNGSNVSCKFFRGFELRNGKLSPIDMSSGMERKRTFHVSPMYLALREGLVYCTKHNLLQHKRMLSVGATNSGMTSPQIDNTRRIYYKISAAERGKQLVGMWGDLDRYIAKSFEMQTAS